MTRGSRNPIVPPLKDHESTFHRKKDKKVDESSSTFQFDKFESFKRTPNKKGIEYEPGTERESEEEV